MIGKRMTELQVEGVKGKGTTRRRWDDRVRDDLKERMKTLVVWTSYEGRLRMY